MEKCSSADVLMFMDIKMGTLSWIIWVNQCNQQAEEEDRIFGQGVVTTEKEAVEIQRMRRT